MQFYTLSASRKKDPVYAMVVISSVSMHEGKLMYMIDKVAKIDDKAEVANTIVHLKKLSYWLKTMKMMAT